MLLGVYNLISQMRGFQQENKTLVKQSHKYHHHCANMLMIFLVNPPSTGQLDYTEMQQV
jgi:hypothetical protein